MSIKFVCASCGKGFSVKAEMAGRKGKCSACGAMMTIPAAAAPILAYPAAEPTPAPLPVPEPVQFAHGHPSHNVQVVVNQDQGGKHANGLGVAGVVLGVLCLIISWIPLFNVLVIPGAFLGGLLALIGLFVALTNKKSGVGWPITGMGLNFSAFVVMILANVILAGGIAASARDAEKKRQEAQAKINAAAQAPPTAEPGKDRDAIVRKGIDAMRKAAATSFGTIESEQAEITADQSGVKDFGETNWEVKGLYVGPDKDGMKFKAPWTAKISFMFGSLQCTSVRLGDREPLP